MTQHWWMHWFWVTVGAVLGVLACQCWCAPQGTFQPDQHAVPTDPSHYMALLADIEHAAAPPVDYVGGYEEDETYGPGSVGNLFPLPAAHALPPKVLIRHQEQPFADAQHQTTFIPIHSLAPQDEQRTFEPTHEHLVLDEQDPHTKDDLVTRLAKAIVTTALPSVPVQFKNRNPHINEEMHAVNWPAAAPTLVAATSSPAPLYVTPMATEAAAVEEHAATEEAEVAASSAAPSLHESEPDPTNESTPSAAVDGHKLTEESTPAEAPEPTKEAEEVVNAGTHPIPPWIPDSKQEDADSEEEEREMEQIDRITNALVEEETAEEGEAITRGRMSPDKSLGTASIVGIALGFVGIISMAGAVAGFMLYRRSMLNKPQTLNDKISNPDYSSYIDDTLRDNSEEMYSLDNDSFLNSLEAMTIQNYWTENVKHTKL